MTTTSIQFSLDRGERQLWAGVPRQGLVFRPSDALQIPFSLLWAGFAVFWEMGVFRSGAPIFFLLWGIPFLAIGFYMAIGRFWVDAWQRSRTTYAVTTDRVIINSGLFTPTSKSLNLRTLSDVTLQERPDGTGTITFGAVQPFAAMSAGVRWPGMPQVPAFEMISDARRVYSVIRDAQRGVPLGDAPATPSVGGSDTVRYEPFPLGRGLSAQGAQMGKHLKRFAAACLLILGWYYLTSRNKGVRFEPRGMERYTSAQIDSLRRLPSIVDTFIVKQTHFELTVGDTLSLLSLFAEARDSAGHVVRPADRALNIDPRNTVLKSIGRGFQAVGPGHVSMFIEDQPRDFDAESPPRRPSTRVDIDVRPRADH